MDKVPNLKRGHDRDLRVVRTLRRSTREGETIYRYCTSEQTPGASRMPDEKIVPWFVTSDEFPAGSVRAVASWIEFID